jgi:hypothetical protein
MKNHYLIIFFILLFLLSGQKIYSQDETYKWVIGLGINAVDYFPTNELGNGNNGGFFNELTNASDHWNISGPKISVAKHLKGKLAFEASFSFNKITKIGDAPANDLPYYGLDGNLQYSILRNDTKFTPFLYVGGGYNWVKAYHSAGTVNAGIGANLWITDKYGINAQGGYKYNSSDYELLSHFYYSFSVAMRLFGGRGGSRSGNGEICF